MDYVDQGQGQSGAVGTIMLGAMQNMASRTVRLAEWSRSLT